jgi:hypothetical protein
MVKEITNQSQSSLMGKSGKDIVVSPVTNMIFDQKQMGAQMFQSAISFTTLPLGPQLFTLPISAPYLVVE